MVTSIHAQDAAWVRINGPKVDQVITEKMQRLDAVGTAVGIIEHGKVVYLKGYGFANRETQIPVTTNTLFRWASISKTITAVSAMQLVEQGKLDLEKDVREYVPEFPDKGSVITCKHLLCHQSGIVHYVNGNVIRTERTYTDKNPFKSVILALDTFKDSPLVNAPGEKYSYTTHGYILLSAVVERAGKQPFAEQVSKRICQTLDLRTLQPDYEWESISARTEGYRKLSGKIVRSKDGDVSWKLGGGGFTSTIEDLANYAAGLINRKLMSERTEKMMWTAQKTSKGDKTNYGLGFGVEYTSEGKLCISHSGSQEKTRTLMVLFPDQKKGIVFMTNSEFINPGDFVQAVSRVIP